MNARRRVMDDRWASVAVPALSSLQPLPNRISLSSSLIVSSVDAVCNNKPPEDLRFSLLLG